MAINLDDFLKALELQMQMSLARAAHFNTRVLSGVYKTRKVHQGGHDGPLLTEAQLLEDEVGTADSHMQTAQDVLDKMLRLLNRREEIEELQEQIRKDGNTRDVLNIKMRAKLSRLMDGEDY